MGKSIKGKFVKSIVVTDPDTGGEVHVEIYKLDNGGIVGIDSSFIDSEQPVYSPFDKGVEIDEITFT